MILHSINCNNYLQMIRLKIICIKGRILVQNVENLRMFRNFFQRKYLHDQSENYGVLLSNYESTKSDCFYI